MKISKFQLYLLVIFAIIITGYSAVQAAEKAAVNVAGRWIMYVVTPKGSGSCVFTLKQDGNNLTGNYSGFFGEAPVTGTVKGNNAEFMYKLNSMKATYKGKVNGNKMSGSVFMADMNDSVTGSFDGENDEPIAEVSKPIAAVSKPMVTVSKPVAEVSKPIAAVPIARAEATKPGTEGNVTGRWIISVTTKGGSGSCVFTLNQDGSNLAGNYSCFYGQSPVYGTVNGNEVEIKYTMRGRNTIYKGKVDGNIISGSVDIGEGETTGTFEGTKDADYAKPIVEAPKPIVETPKPTVEFSKPIVEAPKTKVAAPKSTTAVNIAGRWIMYVVTPKGSGSCVFTLKQDGNNLTGNYSGFFGEAPVTGTVKGNNAEFMYKLNSMKATYKGKVNGNKISGSVFMADMNDSVTGSFDGENEE